MRAFLGVLLIRIIVFGGLYWGPPLLGSYHCLKYKMRCSLNSFKEVIQGIVSGSIVEVTKGDTLNPKTLDPNP